MWGSIYRLATTRHRAHVFCKAQNRHGVESPSPPSGLLFFVILLLMFEDEELLAAAFALDVGSTAMFLGMAFAVGIMNALLGHAAARGDMISSGSSSMIGPVKGKITC